MLIVSRVDMPGLFEWRLGNGSHTPGIREPRRDYCRHVPVRIQCTSTSETVSVPVGQCSTYGRFLGFGKACHRTRIHWTFTMLRYMDFLFPLFSHSLLHGHILYLHLTQSHQ